MYRVTDSVNTFTLPTQANTYKQIEVTYRQIERTTIFLYKNNTLPDGMTLDGKNVVIEFTQEQTKALVSKYPIIAQVRAMDANGKVHASQEFTVSVKDVLSENILVEDEN